VAPNFGNLEVIGILWGSNEVYVVSSNNFFYSFFELRYNLVLKQVKLRRFSAPILKKLSDVARLFPKRRQKASFRRARC
jgi:hypothetical protein